MKKIFNDYVKKYDLTIKPIMGKYHHSFRVMEFAKEIAISLGLSDKDIKLASDCGLLHDIARFKQYSDYETYIDRLSFDHGDVGYEILKDLLNNEDKDIILISTKYHNKYVLPELDERTKLFCNIVRDADKLDIMKEQFSEMKDEKVILKEELLDDIYNHKICRNELIKSDSDCILRCLSWINDLNFKYSYEYLLKNNIIEDKFNLLSLYGETEEIKEFKNYIFNRIEERIKEL